MEAMFVDIGLSEAKAKETAKNAKVAQNLVACVEKARAVGQKDPKEVGALLYHVASKMKPQVFHHSPAIVEYICRGQIDSEVRLNAALDYVLKNPAPQLDTAALESACGVGIVVTPEQIEKAVEDVIAGVKGQILEKRYRYPVGALMAEVRKIHPWADGKAVKAELDIQVLDLLGPKTEADLAPPPKAEKKKKGGDEKKSKPEKTPQENGVSSGDAEEDGAATIAELMKTKVHFHKPGDNFTTDGYVVTPKTKEILAAHLKRTGGRVHTRFPPEPNGLLHIGHAKAININFGYAAAHDGVCFLRYDDTNPEKEEEKFFRGIKDVVEWLGYKPYKITHSSDYFHQLYEWAKVSEIDGKIVR